ncbi:hypothetical protein [Halorussus sp. MSC15.2]|uniref:hypothetical protein n=1 Tax=Halorussus sp. MSC15.2 TaxID=2283638 RepID=UPI0013D7A8F0|nr:hypothetical protein [Halorussus sp. MSC15.2]NEU57382.1 hypothetical protein [Halorussus sp. MSC15.2]
MFEVGEQVESVREYVVSAPPVEVHHDPDPAVRAVVVWVGEQFSVRGAAAGSVSGVRR